MNSSTTTLERDISKTVSPKISRFKQFRSSNWVLTGASAVLLFIIVCAVVPGWIAPYSPTEMKADALMQPPSIHHLLGTDQFGRDLFSLVVYGAKQSLLTGIAAVVIGGLLGTFIGIVAGYYGGIIDTILMRGIDILMTIPNILLAIAVASALGPSLENIIIAISVASIPSYARVIRGQVISTKNRQFVDASQAIGASNGEIILRHILPNCFSPLLVMATLGVGTSILIGTGLSFLGLGIVQEIPDWGYLLSQGRSYISVAWWIVTFPGLAITLLVVAVNILGDELRRFLDPKGRSRV